MFSFNLISILSFYLCFELCASKANPDKCKLKNDVEKTKNFLWTFSVFMDKLCGTDAMVLDGDSKPGTWFRLTSASKYQPNMSCTAKFRALLSAQRFVITVESLNIADCPGDTLKIYDGTNLLNKDVKQQCGTSSTSFFFTVRFQFFRNENRKIVLLFRF